MDPLPNFSDIEPFAGFPQTDEEKARLYERIIKRLEVFQEHSLSAGSTVRAMTISNGAFFKLCREFLPPT